ncbi:hypothetical protein [Mesorhizobium australicum]|uniref:Uncharacterized protein n=1 Tax=Mesorhizobium australicum TaxID=536018 RepID=A0A1X7MN90_9HYPH|nr:hypothetical protein [Mesorhizobium australicum]SMH26155.1 hypothetical protein SAMN02982922_0054 [Mesorhizobium australicum]
MTTAKLFRTSDTSLGRDISHAIRYHLRGWRGPAVLAAVISVAGLAFGWGWLVAGGIAPLILAVLPCAAMCALSLCASRMAGKQCSADAVSKESVEQVGPAEPNSRELRPSRD